MKHICLVLLCMVYFSAKSVAPKQPNVVLIIADDVGWNDVSFHGSNQIPTPNIDALAYNGIILNRFYTEPACTPSRTALLTGLYPMRTSLQGYPIIAGVNRYLPLQFETLPQRLKKCGFDTKLIGKWHLGASYTNVTPIERGFDYHYGYWHGLTGYFSHQSSSEVLDMVGLDFHEGLTPNWGTVGQYVTTLFTNKAVDIISTHNTSRPLFLMISHLAAHSGDKSQPLQVPDVEENDRQFGYIENNERRLFAGVMNEMDKSVGQVMQALNNKGILDDTVIIFMSDNGAPSLGEHRNWGSNWPLRGTKLTMFEGGIKGTATVYYSKMQNKGIINNELIHISDLMPTIYSAAGCDVTKLGQLDGMDQWGVLMNGEQSKRTEILVEIDEVYDASAIIGMKGRYKLINGSLSDDGYDLYDPVSGRESINPPYDVNLVINSVTNKLLGNNLTEEQILSVREQIDLAKFYSEDSLQNAKPCEPNQFCLFNILEDPCETNDISGNYPVIVGILKAKLANYRKQLMPQAILPEDPRANPTNCNGTWFTWMDSV